MRHDDQVGITDEERDQPITEERSSGEEEEGMNS